MADADFYNRNIYRRYPFIDESLGAFTYQYDGREDHIVDFGVVFYPAAGFDQTNAAHRVVPQSMINSAGQIQLTLRVTAPGQDVDQAAIVLESTTDYQFVSFTLQATDSTPWGYGFAVLGKVATVVEPGVDNPLAVRNTPLEFIYVEPALIQVVDGHYVNRFVIANEPRTSACESQLSSSAVRSSSSVQGGEFGYTIAPGGARVDGDTRFREGYNMSIVVLENNNAIRFSGRRGAGEGLACEEVPKTDAEQALKDAGLVLDCALRCDEVLHNINGIGPNNAGRFFIQGGNGVEVKKDGPHAIRITGRASLEEC